MVRKLNKQADAGEENSWLPVIVGRLRQVLIEAVEHTPYYRGVPITRSELRNEDPFALLSAFALLTKDEVLAAPKAFLSARAPSWMRYPAASSGSSGRGIAVWRTKRLADIEKAFLDHYWEPYGWHSERSRILRIGHDSVRNYADEPVQQSNNVLFVSPFHLQEQWLPKIIQKICAFAPEFLYSYSRCALELARFFLQSEEKLPPLCGVILASEPLPSVGISTLQQAFQAPISIHYGLTERTNFAHAAIALGERRLVYRLNALYAFQESHVDALGRHEIVGTSYWNTVMPLIRYRTGDFGRIENGVISSMDGKEYEYLITKTGAMVSPYVIDLDDDHWDIMEQYQICQKRPGAVVARVLPRPGCSGADFDPFFEDLQRQCEGFFDVSMELVDHIPRLPSGKTRFVLHELEGECPTRGAVNTVAKETQVKFSISSSPVPEPKEKVRKISRTALFGRLKSSLAADALVRRTPGIYGRLRSLLRESEIASPVERRALRDHLTERTLKLASTTAFARGRGHVGSYEGQPVLDKEELRAEARNLARKSLLPVNVAETGGTTGIPLSIRRSWVSVVFEQAVLDHLVEKHSGVDLKTARTAVLRGDTIKDPSDMTPPFWRLTHGRRHLALSANHLNTKTVKYYFEALKDFNPEILWVYPTALEALCRLDEAPALSLPVLKLVLASSEVLSIQANSEARAKLAAPIMDYYGQAERVCFSHSIVNGEHFFMPVYGRVELSPVYDDDEFSFYEIVGTTYWNKAQPLVRYRTGDMARLPKGMSAAEVEEVTLGLRPFFGIEGRQSDYLISDDGTHLIGINHIPRGVDDIVQMQLQQPARNRVDILVVPKSTYSLRTEELIIQKARQKVPASMDIKVICVENVYRTHLGKAPLVVRLIHE